MEKCEKFNFHCKKQNNSCHKKTARIVNANIPTTLFFKAKQLVFVIIVGIQVKIVKKLNLRCANLKLSGHQEGFA